MTYRAIRDRIRAEDPQIDEQTLADTVEGLTDLHEIITAIIRSALADEALATGLKGRIADMQERLDRLQDRASKRRQVAKDVMIDLDLKKITAPDFSVSIRAGLPSFMVIDEAAVPSIYWQPSAPRLKRQELLSELKDGCRNRRRRPLQSGTGFERDGCGDGLLSKATAGPAAESRSAGTFARARPMAASSPISRAGSRSRRPTGSLASMAGAERLSTPA